MKPHLLYNFWLIFIVSGIISCNNSDQNVLNEPAGEFIYNEPVKDKEEKKEVDELYIIEGKAVIFFVLSKSELKKLTKELGSSYRYETDYLFNNFKQQAKSFKRILKKHNIQSELIPNKNFLIKLKNGQTVSFNRIREDQIMGEIISDGIQDPKIEFGMFSNKELTEVIKKYFQIENFGFVENKDSTIHFPTEEKLKVDSMDQVIQE